MPKIQSAQDEVKVFEQYVKALRQALGLLRLTGLDKAIAIADYEAGLTVEQCLAKRTGPGLVPYQG